MVNMTSRVLKRLAAEIIKRELMTIKLCPDASWMRRKHHNTAAYDQRLFNRVGDEKQRKALFFPERQQLFLHRAPRQRIQGGEGFVHQQDARFHRQRTGDGDALLHAAGERMGHRVSKFRQTDFVKKMQRRLFCL